MVKLLDASSKGSAYGETDRQDPAKEQQLQRRLTEIDRNWQRYKAVMEATGFQGTSQVRETERWVQKTNPTDDESDINSLASREEFFRGYGGEIIREGLSIHELFYRQLAEATPYISTQSREKWVKRYKDEKVSFQAKRYWIKHQFPSYITAWKNVVAEYEKLKELPGFKLLNSKDGIDLSKFAKKADFLQLHYDKRIDLVNHARAVIAAKEKKQEGLLARAKLTLNMAVMSGAMSAGKVGTWLARIFDRHYSQQEIHAFLSGTGANSLNGFIANWQNVRNRYDKVAEKIKNRGSTKARGFTLMSPHQFLSMSYTQRLLYVDEAERRAKDANNLSPEREVTDVEGAFIRIRHAFDLRDWEEAAHILKSLEKKQGLNEKQSQTLESMKRYLRQFHHPTYGDIRDSEAVVNAKRRMDQASKHIPVSLQPMLRKGLRSVKPNRFFQQWRWIVYNNKWCREHGYLTRQKAARGAQKENEWWTKQKAESGEDIGLHDSIGHTTSGQQFFRKKERAKHKPTLMHLNTQSPGAVNTVSEWLDREQNPRVLYWTTFCGHDEGIPKSENWHNDLFFNLTELRAATRTLQNAGLKYEAEGLPLAMAA